MSVPKEQNVWIVNENPAAEVQPDTFKLVTKPIPELKDGEVLVKVEFISNDPAQRGWIQKGADPVSLKSRGANEKPGLIGVNSSFLRPCARSTAEANSQPVTRTEH